MKVAIGCDHAGLPLKGAVREVLERLHIETIDFGTDSTESVDYPDFGEKVGRAVASGLADLGIVMCGTGIGISIAANKVPGVRAALCHDTFSAKMSRAHNDANILALGARVVGAGLAQEIVEAWLGAQFEGGRHAVRVEKIGRIEQGRKEEQSGASSRR